MGEAINLVNNFKVEKVIFNCGIYNVLYNGGTADDIFKRNRKRK